MLAIPVPDVRLMEASTKASVYDLLTLIHQNRRECRTLAALRDTLLPELLAGRIAVPEAAGRSEAVA